MISFFIFLFLFILSLVIYLIWLVRFKEKSTKIEKRTPILVYHKIDYSFEWGITRQKVGQFENQIKYLFENGYKSLSLEDTLQPEADSPVTNKLSGCQLLECEALPAEADLPMAEALPSNKSVAITFDDGYESAYRFALPILQKYGFVASVFVITGYTGKFNDWDVTWGKRFKHLSWEQIKELDKYGFSFGSHTVSHPDLTKLDSKSLEYELFYSQKILEDKIGKGVVFLSYPFGKYNTKVQEMAKKAGYQRAFTLHSHSNNMLQNNSTPVLLGQDPLALERMGMYLFDSPLTLHIKLNDGRLFWIEDMKGRIINRFATGTVLAKPKTHPPEIV
jgi:peptidoglycan/xylan/chitin deacetylase (PgdA/CDA1 family)